MKSIAISKVIKPRRKETYDVIKVNKKTRVLSIIAKKLELTEAAQKSAYLRSSSCFFTYVPSNLYSNGDLYH